MNPEIAALLAQLMALLQADPPKPVDPPGTINGHSIEGDEDGFAIVPAWLDIFNEEVSAAKLNEKQKRFIWARTPQRLNCESVQNNCEFVGNGKVKSYMNLCRRNSTIAQQLGGDNFTHDAILFELVPKPVSQERDWNVSPQTQASRQYSWKDAKILVCENGEGAWSGNWNPAQNVEYFNKLYRAKVKAEIEALKNTAPSGFGVR